MARSVTAHLSPITPPLPAEAVTVDAFINYPPDNQLGRQAEAEQVVIRVKEAKQSNPEGSIAILVRNRNPFT